ncbi:hypothetical protein GQ54DRAFT_241953, partial [Martensiomyces pterosporus]
FEYPQGDRKPISVTGADICRLYRGEFLNDTVIEFYLRYIAENLRTRNPQLYDQCFFFNTFFFKKLSRRHKGMSAGSSEKLMETVYGQLKKWTANADLFAKKYIFVPINENIHWYLAIIINPELLLSKEPNIDSSKYQDPFASSSIIILDSLGSKHQPTFGLLRGYIQSEAKHRRNRDVVESLVGKYAKVPLQNNLCDCGVFLLHYVEEFL